MKTDIDALRDRFIAEMTKATGHNNRLLYAFRKIDRADFVPTYLAPDPDAAGCWPVRWKRFSREDGIPWAGRLYSPRAALVTRLDDDGRPSSSSTDPCLMAEMIDALRPPVGGRILEIGLGTGYNAAVLSLMVGDQGRIVSLDIDRQLFDAAATRLRGYPNVSPVLADGRTDVGALAPYDGILITANATRLERAWLSALKPRGRLVVNLRGPMASGLFAGTAAGCGVLEGRYVDFEEVGFTPLHGHPLQAEPALDDDLIGAQHQVADDRVASAARAIIGCRAARTFMQFMVPAQKSDFMITGGDLQEGRPAALLQTAGKRCWICLPDGGGTGSVSWAGDELLLQALADAHRAWLSAGAPEPTAMELTIGGPATVVSVAGRPVCQSPLFLPGA